MHAERVAIIADGNGRWARARSLPIPAGHEAGADTLHHRLRDATQLGIRQLTVYFFSTENWRRPESEVKYLMTMLGSRLAREARPLHRAGVRMRFIGDRTRLPERLVRMMQTCETLTMANRRLILFIAVNYGGRAEILEAAHQYQSGGEEAFRRHLYAGDMLDPQLLIRTGGEQRLSNFLLWQAAHAELVFRDELWPDFDRCALEESLDGYRRRQEQAAPAVSAGFA
jgi:undecaprenyl diphosphate synthase